MATPLVSNAKLDVAARKLHGKMTAMAGTNGSGTAERRAFINGYLNATAALIFSPNPRATLDALLADPGRGTTVPDAWRAGSLNALAEVKDLASGVPSAPFTVVH